MTIHRLYTALRRVLGPCTSYRLSRFLLALGARP